MKTLKILGTLFILVSITALGQDLVSEDFLDALASDGSSLSGDIMVDVSATDEKLAPIGLGGIDGGSSNRGLNKRCQASLGHATQNKCKA